MFASLNNITRPPSFLYMSANTDGSRTLLLYLRNAIQNHEEGFTKEQRDKLSSALYWAFMKPEMSMDDAVQISDKLIDSGINIRSQVMEEIIGNLPDE